MPMNQTNPCITAAVVMYNAEKYIQHSLESLLSQTYSNLEIIVVNNSSTDSSLEIANRLAGKDPRIQIITQKNTGVSSARNTAIKNASGEWLVFVDADDAMPQNAIALLYEKACEYSVPLVIGTHSVVGSDGKMKDVPFTDQCFIDPYQAQKYFLVNSGHRFPWGKLYHRSVYTRLHYPDGLTYEDVYVFPELLDFAGKCALVNQTVYRYYLNNDSITYSSDISRQLDGLKSITHYAEYIENKYPELARFAYSNVLSFCLFLMGRVKRSGYKANREYLTAIINTCNLCYKKIPQPSAREKLIHFSINRLPYPVAAACNMYSTIKNHF